jgi:hydroxyacylglutathione hydrolase
MYIEQLYTNCLSEAAYFIESSGEVAIIDPLRDIEKYIQMAEERNAQIKYIFETHFHADFVSGHLELAKATDAQIIYGPEAKTNFEKYEAKDGEIFQLGKISLKAIHTPGHTLESTCYLLLDEAQQPHVIFTGDTLFVGDVGRPDLFSGNLDKEDLAAMMFDSLKILKSLPDTVKVYPAHGPGSSCGKNLGPNTHSTIGQEKANNYAMKHEDKTEFIKEVTAGLNTPPAYFPINASINQKGYVALDEVIQQGMKALSVADVKNYIQQDVLLLDTRHATVFTQGYIPTSLFIGLEGRFAEWAGSLISFKQKIILITEIGREQETIIRLARVGFDNVIGYLDGGFEIWKNAGEQIDMIIDIEADELKMDMNYDHKMVIIDVRKELEFENGHVKSAINIPLQSMTDLSLISNFEETENIYIHCAGGYRSVIASAILKRQDIHNIRNVLGGYTSIKEIFGMPLVISQEILN